MSKLAIVGAGGLGRELSRYLCDSRTHFYEMLFLDDHPENARGGLATYRLADAHLLDLRHYIIAVGNPLDRASLLDRMRLIFKTTDVAFRSFVSDRSKIYGSVDLGPGVVITPYCVLTTDIIVGMNTFINLNCTVGHDTFIGNHCVINPGCNISGNVHIGDKCLIGTGATILEGVRIASGCTVGAGAVVTKDVTDPSCPVVGVPARPLAPRSVGG